MIRYIDALKTIQEVGAGVYDPKMGTNIVIPMGVSRDYRAEITSVIHCLGEIRRRNIINKRITIYSGGHAAIKAIQYHKKISKYVQDCKQILTAIGDTNNIMKL